MSIKDRDRLKVLHEVQKRHISQKEAAAELGLSTRWVRQMLGRVRKEGDGGVLHRLRGRASNRKIPEKVKQKTLAIFRKQKTARQWHDYGPTLAAEELAADYGICVGKETLRKWLIQAGLWKPRAARLERIHQWRARRERLGELIQWDTSEHDWLEGRGEKLYLIAMIDDATSRILARFVRHDSTEENLRLLRTYLETHGRPLAFYTDKASLFQTAIKTRRQIERIGREDQPMPPTHIGRALQDLGIEWIAAHSPQAKGRVERFFGTAQDRLVKGLRKAAARTIEEANLYLAGRYLPDWNRRFTRPPALATDAHRKLIPTQDLDSVLSVVVQRQVAQDYTLRWHGVVYRIPRPAIAPGMRGSTTFLERRRDGSVWLRWRAKRIPLSPCEQPPAARDRQLLKQPSSSADSADSLRRQREGQRKWQASWNRQPNPPLWKALRDSNAGA